MKLVGLQKESEWLGKTYIDVAFQTKENVPAEYYKPLADDFTSREYYNKFHDIYVHTEKKPITIPNLNRKMNLTILTDVTTQRQLENKMALQNIIHNCLEALYTAGVGDKTSEDAYYDVLNQLKSYYESDITFFYKFKDGTYEVENIYEVFADGVEPSKHTFPITVPENQMKLLEKLSKAPADQYQSLLDTLDTHDTTSLKALHAAHHVVDFSCVSVYDKKGQISACMGVTNPKKHENVKELMKLLTRFICMFIEHQQDESIKQEAMAMEETSKKNLAEKCIRNFANVASANENITDILNSLCLHYEADSVGVLLQQEDGTYVPSYVGGPAVPDLAKLQTYADSLVKQYIKVLETTPTFASSINFSDSNDCSTNHLLREQFDIENFIVSPIKDTNQAIIGLLILNNIKLMNRANLIIHMVAESISNYLSKIRLYEATQLRPMPRLTNKVATQKQISKLLEEQNSGALFILDIDNFKTLNDTLGLHIGDQVIMDFADILSQTFSPTDVIGRIGGDEFLVFSPQLTLDVLIENKANLILQKCQQHYERNGMAVDISASIGICTVDEKCKTFQPLYENADYALYVAKKSGKSQYHVYSDAEYASDTSVANELQFYPNVVRMLKSAVENHGFVVHYQPIHHVPTGTYTQAEALVRIVRPDGTLACPDDFIKVAETTGLVVDMTYDILEQVCRDFRQLLNAQPDTTLTAIAINVPYLQFTDPHMESRFLATLKKYDILPSQIKLEITERSVIADMELMRRKMASLTALGFAFELDDFGTDYSNLKMCVSLPVDIIKLDRSLLLAAMDSDADRRFFQYILLAIHESDRHTVMEGVETQEQLDWAIGCDCQYIQGYYFSKAVDFHSFARLLGQQSKSAEQEATTSSCPIDSPSPLLDLLPQAAVIVNIQSNEIVWSNTMANQHFFFEGQTGAQKLEHILTYNPATLAVYAAVRKELQATGKSILHHVYLKTAFNRAEQYDIHIAYVDETQEAVYLIFALSAYELERMAQQNTYYSSLSNAAYYYPFHLDIKTKRMEFFNPGFDLDYHMPMVMENFPEPLFAYRYIYEEDKDAYMAMVDRMYKGEPPQGSFRFYDVKGNLLRYSVNYVVNRDATGHPLEVNGDFILQADSIST